MKLFDIPKINLIKGILGGYDKQHRALSQKTSHAIIEQQPSQKANPEKRLTVSVQSDKKVDFLKWFFDNEKNEISIYRRQRPKNVNCGLFLDVKG